MATDHHKPRYSHREPMAMTTDAALEKIGRCIDQQKIGKQRTLVFEVSLDSEDQICGVRFQPPKVHL